MPPLVCVTGADGFIGSHLVHALLQQGQRVRALVWYNAFGHYGWLDELPAELADGLEIVAGDIRDRDAMSALLDGVATVYHLAALIGIPYSYVAADSYVQTNVTGTLNLLQAAKAHKVRRFIHVSTSEVYGSAQQMPMDETHPLTAQSPYAASKIAADQMALAFCRSFALPVVVVRPFNTYGPRQSARAVIPTVITQLLTGQKQIHLGDLSPRRDLTYVSDTVAGLMAAATSEEAVGEVINLGTGVDLSVGEIVEQIMKLMAVKAEIITDPERIRPAASEVDRLLSDNSKAKRLLRWSPSVAIEEGLRRTIAWFREPHHLTCYHTRRYTT